MADDRWDRIEALLDEALNLDEERRPAWLAGVEAELRPELERLLRAHRAADGFLEAPAAAAAAHLVAEGGAGIADGARLGPYRIVREIGRGGMGAVFLAHRDDLGLDVAIKQLPHTVASSRSVHALLAERRTMARLEHPNIARLLDAGLSDGGQPYFVMELIDGQSLTSYCDEHRLDVRARLRLFLDVCGAVDYAHERLVVHRDLKPSNVMVTRSGVPKLLDFGIAKVLDDSAERAETGTVGHFMTPQYASPEQIRGEEVGIASDVYSLGAMLFELLAGRPPHDTGTGTPFEVGRIILESEPPSLGEATATGDAHEIAARRSTSPRRLRQQLQGDLTTIIRQAMHKDRGRRYASPGALADDLRRHLDDRAVLARGDSWTYRSRRYVRRNWLALGLATAAVTAAVLFAVFHTQRVASERDVAQFQAETAGSVSDFLIDVFLAADPDQFDGREPTVRDLLSRGAARVREDVQGDPAVRARLLDVLGDVHTKLGHFEEAQPLLEESLALRQQVLHPRDPEIMQSLTHLASLKSSLRDWEGAAALHRQAYELAVEVYGENAPEAVVRLHNLGTSLRSAGDLEAAERVLRASLDGRRRLFGNEHVAVANAVGSLANLVRDRGRYEEAAELYEEALELSRAVYGEDHVRAGSVWHNLGRMNVRLERYEEAERCLEEALRIARTVYGERSIKLVQTIATRAALRTDRGNLAEAEEDYRTAREIEREQLGPRHPLTLPTLTGLATVQERLGQVAAAESTYAEALATAEPLGKDHPEWSRVTTAHAEFLERQGSASARGGVTPPDGAGRTGTSSP